MHVQQILDRINTSIEEGILPQAIIIDGGSLEERWALAKEIGAQVLGISKTGHHSIHADLYGDSGVADFITLHRQIAPTTKNMRKTILSDQISELIVKLSYKPYTYDRIVAVISEADTMEEQAQNKLLKTLEEPAAQNLIILLATSKDALLQTIVSRCVVFRITDVIDDTSSGVDLYKDGIAILSSSIDLQKPIHDMFGIAEPYIVGQNAQYDIIGFIDVLELILRDVVASQLNEHSIIADICAQDPIVQEQFIKLKELPIQYWPKIVTLIEDARRDIRSDINKKYTFKHMLLHMRAERMNEQI
jgi:hypothetical protein